MLAKMIDKIVSLKETKIFEIGGQTYADASLTRIPPHVDRPDCISVSGLDSICKLIRTELEKVGTTIMVQVKSNDTVEVMTTYLSDFSRNTLYRAKADAPGLYTGFRGREVALIELRSLCIPNEGTAYGLTIFPDDGSTPIVCISAEAPISAAPELLAHELAHVATPEDTEHGESWSAASEAIFKKYNELLGTMIPDEPEPILSPHQPGDGGILTMPLRDNVPEPPTDDWQPTTCPVCGAERWQTDTARRILALEPDVRTACTACALKGLGK